MVGVFDGGAADGARGRVVFVETMFLSVEWKPFMYEIYNEDLIIGISSVESPAMAEPINRVTYLGMPIKFGAKVRAHFGGPVRLSQC